MTYAASSRTALLSLVFVVMWSSGFVGGRLGTDTASTVTLMVWRFGIVALLLGAVLGLVRLLRHRHRLDPRRPRPLASREIAIQAVVGVLGQGVFIWGNVGGIEVGVGAGTAALIAALQPITASALAGPVLGERVRPGQWAGLLVGLLGVGLVVGSDLTSERAAPWWAYGLPLLGMAALVLATLIERSTSASTTPLLPALAIQTAASALLFLVAAVVVGGLAPPQDHAVAFGVAVAWFIGFSTLGAYGAYWLTLRRTDLTHLNSLIYLTPPTTVLWTWVMFADPVTASAMAGCVVCALGVALVHRHRGTDPRRSAHSGQVAHRSGVAG